MAALRKTETKFQMRERWAANTTFCARTHNHAVKMTSLAATYREVTPIAIDEVTKRGLERTDRRRLAAM
jgi:hypothetical protein